MILWKQKYKSGETVCTILGSPLTWIRLHLLNKFPNLTYGINNVLVFQLCGDFTLNLPCCRTGNIFPFPYLGPCETGAGLNNHTCLCRCRCRRPNVPNVNGTSSPGHAKSKSASRVPPSHTSSIKREDD